MLTFVPALRDLRFVIHDVLGATEALQALPRYAGIDAGTLDMVAEESGHFAAEGILPINAEADRVGCRWEDGRVTAAPGFADAWRTYRELGWPSVCADVEWGGQGLPSLAFSMVNEQVSSASLAFVMTAAINHCASTCLQHSASPDLKREWLPKLASGEVLASMCITEPQAGSDVGLITTRAMLDEHGNYRITGAKIFASGGEHDLSSNIANLVLARMPGAPAGSRGLSLFLVPKLLADGQANNVHCDGIEHKMGLHGSPTCALRFEGAQGWLIGEPEGGLRAMFLMMNEARLLTGLQVVGMSETALQSSLEALLNFKWVAGHED